MLASTSPPFQPFEITPAWPQQTNSQATRFPVLYKAIDPTGSPLCHDLLHVPCFLPILAIALAILFLAHSHDSVTVRCTKMQRSFLRVSSGSSIFFTGSRTSQKNMTMTPSPKQPKHDKSPHVNPITTFEGSTVLPTIAVNFFTSSRTSQKMTMTPSPNQPKHDKSPHINPIITFEGSTILPTIALTLSPPKKMVQKSRGLQ